MVCGLAPPLSATVTVALRLPVALGVNFKVNVQLLPAATDKPQVLLWLKSPGLAPPKVIPVIFSALVPTFVSVTNFGALVVPTLVAGKETEVIDSLTSVAE